MQPGAMPMQGQQPPSSQQWAPASFPGMGGQQQPPMGGLSGAGSGMSGAGGMQSALQQPQGGGYGIYAGTPPQGGGAMGAAGGMQSQLQQPGGQQGPPQGGYGIRPMGGGMGGPQTGWQTQGQGGYGQFGQNAAWKRNSPNTGAPTDQSQQQGPQPPQLA